MVLDMEVDFVLDGDPALLPKKGVEHPPPISAHFYCGQMAGCIKMPLGMEVGLSPRDFVFDGDPAPLKKGAEPDVYCGQRLDGSRCYLVRRWVSAYMTLC